MKTIRQTESVRGLQGAWILGTVLALVVCFTAISVEAQSPPAQWKPGQTVVLRVGGSTPAQTTYQVVAAHKAIIEKHVPGVRMILRATSGGPDSMDMMRAGELEMSGNNSAAAYSAHHAVFKDKGKKPLPVYSFFPIYSLEWGAIVPSDSPIRTFRDVVGKRIGLGPKGSGSELTIMESIEALGLTEKDFARIQRSSPPQAFNSLAVGNVDAVLWGTGHPAGTMMEFQATHPMRLVPYELEDLKKITAKFPYYSIGKVPANTYKDQPKDITWLGGSTNGWISRSIPDDLVFAMVKALWENLPELRNAHATQARINAEAVVTQSKILPFHPGAEKYFKSKGIL